MRSAVHELTLELRLAIEQESAILASPDDANFFRKLYSPQKPSSSPVSSSPFVPVPLPDASPPPPSPAISPPKPESPAPAASPPPSSLKALFAKIAPEVPLLEQIPSDSFAKKMATRWKTKNQTAPITLLLFHEPPEQKALLLNIVKALDVHFGPAKLIDAESIERENQWDVFLSTAELKLILACDYTLWQLHSLLPFYREHQGNRTLKNIPLFLLPDLSLYLKDPLLKRSLWKALCQNL